jgi:hypothetical protein
MDFLKNTFAKSLTISTKNSKVQPLASESEQSKRAFRELTEDDFHKEYTLREQVMESTNTGMSVVFATRLSDKLMCVIKIRDRKKSFRRKSDEDEW